MKELTNLQYDAINDIYHSNTMDEMLVKADLHNIDLNNIDVILVLIDTTTYHHAFWPHTAKRFIAFKRLLRTFKELPKDLRFNWLIDRINNTIDEYSHDKFRASTPGGRQEIKNLKQVIKILNKLKSEHK